MAFRLFCLLVLMLFSVASSLNADEFEAPREVRIGDAVLVLNGSGLRNRMFIDLYIGSLYLSRKDSDAKSVIESDEPMAIRLSIVSSIITAEKLRDATLDGFQSVLDDTVTLDDRIEQFLGAFAEPVEVGDSFLLSWNVSVNMLQVRRNDVLVEQVEGLDFKQALFAIWLGDDPAQKSLKDEMLGLTN